MSAQPTSRSGREDGVKVVAHGGVRKSVWLVAGACALLALAAIVLVLTARAPAPPPDPTPEPRAAAAPDAKPDARKDEAPARVAARPLAKAKQAPGGEEPPHREDPPFSFGPPGEKTGMALFPPHGTKPIKIGIVVPEDFEVPEGYVRHYQATEDGELLPAILMFHPDYQWVDDEGNVVELPADRVVPADMAPPGLAIELLELPKGEKGGAD